MKKIYYVETNGYDMLVTWDEEIGVVRYLNSIDVKPYLGKLETVDDDSSWEMDEGVYDIHEWLGDAVVIESARFLG